MKNIGLFLTLFLFSTQGHAAFIRLKAPEIKGEIFAEGLRVTDTQAEVSCRFTKPGEPGHLESKVMPWTYHQKTNDQYYKISIDSKTYWEILPGFDIKNCSYRLIIIAKDKNNISYVGDFILLGAQKKRMSEEDIQEIKESILDIERKFSPLHIFLEHRRGRRVLDFRSSKIDF
jgi:hypothetical protein